MTVPIKLSIITVNLNHAQGLKKTLQSVVSQTYTNYEHIIIDGGSTDDSVAIIKKHQTQYNEFANRLYWVSEPDNGIYHAMNKGIKVAKGEYTLFLNSGDWLIEKGILSTVFADFPNKDIIFGNLKIGNQTICYGDKVTFATFFFGALPHQASFIKKELFDLNGLYNEQNQISSDTEFFLKVIIQMKCTYEHINLTITNFEENGISKNPKTIPLRDKERSFILSTFYPHFYEDYIELKNIRKEILFYRNSRIVQSIKKIQESSLYKKIRCVH